MIEFTFLGINGSVQEPEYGNTALLISGQTGVLAVDLSCNLSALTNADIDAVILTHEHIDHVYGLPSLIHQLWLRGRTRALDIYMPQGLENLVNGLLDLFGIRSKPKMFEIRLRTEASFAVGSLSIRTFRTDHTGTSLGIVVEAGGKKLIYTGDMRPMSVFPAEFEGADVLIHEASGTESEEPTLIRKGHSSGADAGKAAKALGVKRLYLCHLPQGDTRKQKVLQEAERMFPLSQIPDILETYSL
ncbi:MAG: MBL fold metallo-hydrolase [Faecousia sp.]